MGDSTFPLIPILSTICLVLTLIPSAYISFDENPAIAAFMAWQALGCMRITVNRTLWHGNVVDRAPLWCDISSYIAIGKNVGIPASIFCKMWGIYRVMYMKSTFESQREKRTMMIICFFFTAFLPMLPMCFHVLVSGYRYEIVEDLGCQPNFADGWPTTLARRSWPLVFAAGTFVFCVRIIWKCFQLGAARNMFFNQSELDRFIFRRTLVCAVVICLTFPTACIYCTVVDIRGSFEPYPGLSVLRKDYNTPLILSRSSWTASGSLSDNSMSLDEYIWGINAVSILTPLLFFLVFGTGEVAVKYYSRFLWRLSSAVGLASAPDPHQQRFPVQPSPALRMQRRSTTPSILAMEFAENRIESSQSQSQNPRGDLESIEHRTSQDVV